MGHPLPPDKMKVAAARIAAWRTQPGEPVACPVCDAPGLDITDQSARPHMEWYKLACANCGLEDVVNIPMRME